MSAEKPAHKAHRKFSRRARIATGGAVLAAVALGGFGAVSANASGQDAPAKSAAAASVPERATTTSTHLTIDAATRAAQAAFDAAEKENQRVTVAVVDRNGNTVVTLRGDGAGPQSYESAERKAYTAVSWNAPTSELAKRLEQAPNLKDIPGTLFLGGGVPVTAGDAPIAGVGVAGAPSGALDEKFAKAGADAVARR
ncbi:heme-binding protein [Streptomyces sp. 15-116A]|uniref:GlcG/HbpS family heme-binding protein n=1 Tax=Streptomyces sp. 15-116A TaxID=2259035 RepID=UPI0021B3E4D2|nr:heme-binding protein [Streptomyces sp. 15-116A]MCT7351584.1 heme-binding protein [Streptomyces sp. 15-116A]